MAFTRYEAGDEREEARVIGNAKLVAHRLSGPGCRIGKGAHRVWQHEQSYIAHAVLDRLPTDVVAHAKNGRHRFHSPKHFATERRSNRVMQMNHVRNVDSLSQNGRSVRVPSLLTRIDNIRSVAPS